MNWDRFHYRVPTASTKHHARTLLSRYSGSRNPLPLANVKQVIGYRSGEG